MHTEIENAMNRPVQAPQTSVIKWWKAGQAADTAVVGALVELTMDGKVIKAPLGASVLNAAALAGIYIPALCAHPDLPPAEQRGCAERGVGGLNFCFIKFVGGRGR